LTKSCKQTKATASEWRDLQSRFTAITSSANDAMIMIDDDGITSFWNRAAERIFGYKSKEILGRPVSDFIVPPQYYERHIKGLARFKKTGKGRRLGRVLELSALRKNGEEFPMEISFYSSPIRLNGRRHAVAIIHDITTRKLIEAEIQRVKSALEHEHKEAEDIGRSLLAKQPLDSRWTAMVNVEPCSEAGGDRAGFISRRLRDSGNTENWLVVCDASGHGKGAAKFQEVALGGLITLMGIGMSMRDSLKAVNGALGRLGTGRFLVGNIFRLMREDERAAEEGFCWVEEFNVAQHNICVLSPDDAVASEWEWNRDSSSGASLPMGLFDEGLAGVNSNYRRLKRGSRIVAFTDGVTDAVSSKFGPFGRERVQDLIIETRNLSLARSYYEMLRAVKCWVADLPRDTADERLGAVQMTDDMTLAILDIA
jgi:PAS domain S-box-containing protein